MRVIANGPEFGLFAAAYFVEFFRFDDEFLRLNAVSFLVRAVAEGLFA